jgi:PPOX class probable F420-dependent enzyme
MIDLSTEFGRRVQHRLNEERIIWLTTISESAIPQPRPVWFLWDGASFLIYSRPNTFKLQHIQNNPHVALHLDGDGMGGDIVVFTGEAEIAKDASPANQVMPYVEKYRDGMKSLNMTPEVFGRNYSIPIRVKPLSLRGH